MTSGATAVAADLISTFAALAPDCFTGESQFFKDVSPDDDGSSSKDMVSFFIFTDLFNSTSNFLGGIGGGGPDLIAQRKSTRNNPTERNTIAPKQSKVNF